MGTAHPNLVPYQAFATRDGNLMLAVGNDRQFANCCDAIGLPASSMTRVYEHEQAHCKSRRADSHIRGLPAKEVQRHWLACCERGVPAGPSMT